MSNYMGRFSDSILIDFMLETLEDRGYDEKTLEKAIANWNDANGEYYFWGEVLGPAIDKLETTLGHFGLTKETQT